MYSINFADMVLNRIPEIVLDSIDENGERKEVYGRSDLDIEHNYAESEYQTADKFFAEINEHFNINAENYNLLDNLAYLYIFCRFGLDRLTYEYNLRQWFSENQINAICETIDNNYKSYGYPFETQCIDGNWYIVIE